VNNLVGEILKEGGDGVLQVARLITVLVFFNKGGKAVSRDIYVTCNYEPSLSRRAAFYLENFVISKVN
jgi:hypothetical protein